MDNTFTKKLLFSVFLAIFTLLTIGAFAQTITVGAVDPGPFGQGSSIAVPINVNTSGGCVNPGNTYTIYLSDASGNFTPGTPIGSYTGVYGTFVNGVIPNGTPAGAGYKVEVKSSNPGVTSTVSSSFTISSNPGVTASLTESETVSAGVFGRCVGTLSPYTFTSSAGGTVTASIFNEGSQSYDASNVPIPAGGYSFTPIKTNYTVTGKSVNGSGTVGTYGYELVNNQVVNPFSPFGTPFVCIAPGGTGDLQFIIPVTGPGSIPNNYPGTNYTVDWGDGTSTTFTTCQIIALGGILVHTYSLPTCGMTATGGVTNALTIISHAISPYCLEIASPATTSAKVIIRPDTKFAAPFVACVGTALTIPNTSDPGPDYSPGASSSCAVNGNAKYDWTLDGVAVPGYQGVPLSKSFIFPATTTHGVHHLVLHAETPAIGCASTDYPQDICFEDPPQPVFTMPTPLCVTGGPVSPTNTSTVDNTCAVPQYIWTVTGPAPVGYAGGTNSHSAIPQFVFTAAGFYTVQLGISSVGCGVVNAAPQTIAVDAPPTTSMSPNAVICGNNLTFTFDPSQTTTKTVVSGTTLPTPTTFSWVITGGAKTYLAGTDSTSQYPQILFADYATYTVKVTNTNSCGTSTASQTLTFVQAPTAIAGPDTTVCASNPAVSLHGGVTGSYTSYQWVGGTGTFSPNRNTANATYTPSNAEITAGTVTLTFQVNNTGIPAPCDKVTDNMKITITPTAFITSPPTASVCSGQALAYLITANSPLATFTWTSSLTSGTATGFTASGSGPNITDVIINSGNINAIVTYNILPTINGCPGTPFTLTVTIFPLPTITAVPVSNPICNNNPANIALTSNVVNTTYTWTSTVTAGSVTGNTNQATALSTSSIQDILSNSGSTPGTVTYTVTPYNGTCPGTPVVTSITVEPSPVTANAGPDDTICGLIATNSYTLQGNGPGTGTGKWTVIGSPAGVTFVNDTDPNTRVDGLIPGNIYQFTWTITNYPTCPSSSSTVTIKVDLPPVGGTATANPTEVCSGSGSQITLSGQTGNIVQWESSTDGGLNWTIITNTSSPLVIPSLTQTTQYRALVRNGASCPDMYSTKATVTVDQPPIASIAGPDDEVCSQTDYILSGNNPLPGKGKWTAVGNPPGVTFVNDTVFNTKVTGLVPGNTYQFMWTISNMAASCPSTTSMVTIKDDPSPVGGTTASDAHVCSGSNAGTITLSGQSGKIARWEYNNGGSWLAIADTTTVLSYSGLTLTTQYRAVIHSGICPDTVSTPTTITVDQPPIAAYAGLDDKVCSQASYILQGNNPAPGKGKWTLISGPGAIIFADDTLYNSNVSGLVPGNTYKFMWTISNRAGSCPSTTDTVTIIDDQAPVGGTTLSDAHVCSGTNQGTIRLTGQSGTILHWEYSDDNGGSWHTIANITSSQDYLNLTKTTMYRAWVRKTTTCPDTVSTITTITVDPPPPASNAGPNDRICDQPTYTLHGNAISLPNTGLWTMVSGPSTASFTDATSNITDAKGLIPGTYVFRWTISNTAACPSVSSDVTIIIDKAPIGGTTSSDATVCAGNNGGRITLINQSGTILGWEYSENGGPWQPIFNTGVTLDYLNLTQTTAYRAIVSNGVCLPVRSTPTTITVDQPPITANAGPDAEVCGQPTYQLGGNVVTSPNTGVWTMLSGPSVATFDNAASNTATAQNLVPGTYVFRWTISNGGACPPNHDDVSITIDQAPAGGTTSSDATVCAVSNGGLITLSNKVGTVLRWEYSNDNSHWLTILNTTSTLVYSNLTQTTYYRAVVGNGLICPIAYSTPTTITVDQPPAVAIAGINDEVCNTPTYTLNGNPVSLPDKGLWTMVSGPTAAIFVDSTKNNTVVNGLVPGDYVFRWTITNTAACPPTHDDVTIRIDPSPIGGTTLGSATVCAGVNGGPITLSGKFGNVIRWESSIDSSNWVSITNTTTTFNYKDLTQTTYYRAWVSYGICPDVPSTVTTITVDQPPVLANAGADDEVCSQVSYKLNAIPVQLPNKGQWSMVNGPSLPAFSDPADPQAVVSGLIPGVYKFRWTVSNAGACPPTADDVTITIDQAPVGGVTSSDAIVCSGGNSGQIHLASYVGLVVGWEFSLDGTNWQPIANTTLVQQYLNLTRTTYYRAVLRNGLTCPVAYSTPTTITVNPQTPLADAGQPYNLCNQTSTILKGNDPGTFVGVWTQTGGPPVTIADPNNYTTSVTGMKGGNVYKFTWTIKGLPPCGDTFADITIGVSTDVAPSFAMDQDHGCGPVTVTFTNTSTPSPTGGTFVWNFGDGSPQVTALNPPAHTFQPSNDGTVAIYEVTMIPTSNCGSQAPYVAYVKVSSAKPVASFNPAQTSACGTFTLSAQNLSPGDNAQYDFYLKDANGNIVQHLTYPDTRDAVFQPMTVTQQTYYSMYLVVIDKCGNQVTTPSVNIPVSPSSLVSQIQIKGDLNSVCLGNAVTFQNISTGGDKFTITLYDSNKNVILTMPGQTGDMNYTPTATGVYYVSITAGNTGCGDAPVSELKQFTVYPIPAPNFTWTADQNFNVTFNNTTPGVANIPASSLTYKWDFGDGSTFDPSYIPATHHFDFSKAPFTVTLTATTPGTDCSDVTQQTINIKFQGNLFLPNAFIPASSNKGLNTYIAKGFGLKTWRMQIFNNFGQLVWETTKLDNNGAPLEGWDGTYKGRIVEQGVYIWQITATLLNGEEWKGMAYHNSAPSKTGAIHLIR